MAIVEISRFTGHYPLGAHFYDYRDQSFIRLERRDCRLLVYVWYDHQDIWEIAPKGVLGIFKEGWRLDKHPSLSWSEVQALVKDSLKYQILRQQTDTTKPKLPFMRLKKGLVVTKTKFLSWKQRLYLCYVRGFRRNPEDPSVSFIKDLNE